MVAKKHSKRTSLGKTTKTRQTTDTPEQDVAAESVMPADVSPVETAEAASVPTAETTGIDTSVSSEMETITPDPTLPNQPTQAAKLSAVDAAARVLGETGQALTCAELIAAMAARGYWSSPRGRTPAGTLYSAVLREMQTKGDQARFCKTARGKFALREKA